MKRWYLTVAETPEVQTVHCFICKVRQQSKEAEEKGKEKKIKALNLLIP